MIEENPRYTVRELVNKLEIPRVSVHNHLTKLGYINRSDAWIPRELTHSNKLQRISTCALLLQRHNSQPFLNRLITGLAF